MVISCISDSELKFMACIYIYIYIYTRVCVWLSFLNGNPIQYFYLENPMDGGAWQAVVSVHLESDMTCRRPWFDSWVRKIPWRRDQLSNPVFLGFPGGSDGKEPACNVGDLGLIPGLGSCLVAKLCLTLCDSMGLPGLSVCGISQARILEWIAISYPRGSS